MVWRIVTIFLVVVGTQMYSTYSAIGIEVWGLEELPDAQVWRSQLHLKVRIVGNFLGITLQWLSRTLGWAGHNRGESTSNMRLMRIGCSRRFQRSLFRFPCFLSYVPFDSNCNLWKFLWNSFETPLKIHWTSCKNPLKMCFLTGGTLTSQQFDFALASVGRSTHHQIGGSAAEVDRFGKCLLCSGAPIVWIYVEQHVEQYVEKYVDKLKGLDDLCIILYGCFNDMFNHISISCQSRYSKCTCSVWTCQPAAWPGIKMAHSLPESHCRCCVSNSNGFWFQLIPDGIWCQHVFLQVIQPSDHRFWPRSQRFWPLEPQSQRISPCSCRCYDDVTMMLGYWYYWYPLVV